MRRPALLAIALLVAGHANAVAATGENASPASDAPPALAKEADRRAWSFSAYAYYYFVPDDSNYAQPTFTADRDWLHLEARYNYEDHDTGSVWVGYNLEGGEGLAWELTPMLGGVLGETNHKDKAGNPSCLGGGGRVFAWGDLDAGGIERGVWLQGHGGVARGVKG